MPNRDAIIIGTGQSAPALAGAIRLPRSRHRRHDFAMIVPHYT
jgi:hypothetical protein